MFQLERGRNLTKEKGLECGGGGAVKLTISFKSGQVLTVFEEKIKINNTPQKSCNTGCLTKTIAEVVRDNVWLQVAVFGATTVISLSTLIIIVRMCKNIRREKKLFD